MAITTATVGSIARKWTTPQLLRAGLWISWGASTLLLITSLVGVQNQRQAIKTLGKDTAPSVITAQSLKSALSGMDANAVNELLAKPGTAIEATKGYQERLQSFSERMVAAAENITYGDAERKPLITLQQSSAEYIALLQQARDFHATGQSESAIVAYRSAAKLLDNRLMPAADELDRVNNEQLQKSYEQHRDSIAAQLFLIQITGLLLIGGLIALQLLLHRRMRRVLNPMLLMATLIALSSLVVTTSKLMAASAHLKDAKENAFTSVHALREARSIAYQANADESRYLFDPANAARYEKDFFAKTDQVARFPADVPLKNVQADLARGQSISVLSGTLYEELSNITYPGEREAVTATLKAFVTYMEIDQQIRQLQRSGNRPAAIALGIGTQAGQSDWAFEQFKTAQQQAYDLNLQAFNSAIEQGFKDLDGYEMTLFIFWIAIALFVLFGLRPRLREYAV